MFNHVVLYLAGWISHTRLRIIISHTGLKNKRFGVYVCEYVDGVKEVKGGEESGVWYLKQRVWVCPRWAQFLFKRREQRHQARCHRRRDTDGGTLIRLFRRLMHANHMCALPNSMTHARKVCVCLMYAKIKLWPSCSFTGWSDVFKFEVV